MRAVARAILHDFRRDAKKLAYILMLLAMYSLTFATIGAALGMSRNESVPLAVAYGTILVVLSVSLGLFLLDEHDHIRIRVTK